MPRDIQEREGAADRAVAWPEFELSHRGPLGAAFLAARCSDFEAAARHVRALPYGRNSQRGSYRLVISEARGTCSTKHALLAALAQEHGHRIRLMLGIYEMNGRNTPGTGKVLERHGMTCVPEAHCYLKVGHARIDLTCSGGGTEVSMPLLHEEEIEPDQIDAYKPDVHRRFVERWANERAVDPRVVWRVREECIRALGHIAA